MKYINHSIKIDFPLPKALKNLTAEAEELDEKEDIEYICVADTIDVLAKEAYVNRLITKEQWNLLANRYTI